ncbi:MAG: hypothetical protein ACKOC8_05210 [Pirellulales bacterium]
MDMVATNNPPSNGGSAQAVAPSRTSKRPSRETADQAGVQPGSEGTTGPASGGAADRRTAEPVGVSAREAARRIRVLADAGDTLEARTRLRSLATQVRSGGRDAQRMGFIETAIGECLDDSARAASPHGRWLACEAAAWALAWMARTKRAGGSAGGLLERLVGQARAAQPILAAGDTAPARFVLVLARLFADIEACRMLEDGVSATLAAEIERLVSATGSVNVTGSAAVAERVVRWTTCREVARATGGPCWPEAIDRRWKAAATGVLRMLGDRGRIVREAGQSPESFSAPLIEAMIAAGGRRGRTARAMRRGRRNVDGRALLPRAFHDPASAVAVIRTGWGRRDLRVMLDYRHAVPRLEIAAADRLLVDGPWQWEAWADGRSLEAEGPWTLSCWESDRKATFLEIAAPLSGGRQLERQVVVLPRERVVLLADAITTPAGPAPADLRYRGLVQTAASLDLEPAGETREVLVFDTATRMLALPLALPEWRTSGRGSLEPHEGGLVLSQEGSGGRLYAPLWLDCDPERIGRPLTWRQLTVADTRLILPPHQAVGFRVQSGLEQWVVYRALDAARNRTLLGCNVSCEFLLGRVKKSGEVARTLEIQ